MENIIEIKNLSKIYHTKKDETLAIKDFSLDVKEKEFIAIVGPSGCGKSTILSILCGLEKESSGLIKFNKNIKIGYMLQSDGLFEWRNIVDNCTLGLEISNCLNDNAKNKVLDLLNTYGLSEFISKYPSNLSGGMRQRVV